MSTAAPNQALPRSRVPRIAESAVERARFTVVPRRTGPAPRVPFVLLVSFLLIGGVVGLLLFNTSMQQSSFTATALEQRAALLAAEEQSLEMELENLRDPQHVAMEARAIGMVPPANPAFIRLADGRVLGTPTAAVPQDAIRISPLPTPKPKSLRPDPVVVLAPDSAATSGDPTGDDSDGDRERGSDQRSSDRRATAQQGSRP